MRDFLRQLDQVSGVVKTLPIKMGAEAVRFSKERFQKKNWVDKTTQPWEERKHNKGTKTKRSRGVLTDTGRLKRSIRKVYSDHSRVVIGTDVPYAQIHNEGGVVKASQRVRSHSRGAYVRKAHTRKAKRIAKTTVSAHTVGAYQRKINFTMPKRQFLGASNALSKRIDEIAGRELKQALTK